MSPILMLSIRKTNFIRTHPTNFVSTALHPAYDQTNRLLKLQTEIVEHHEADNKLKNAHSFAYFQKIILEIWFTLKKVPDKYEASKVFEMLTIFGQIIF